MENQCSQNSCNNPSPCPSGSPCQSQLQCQGQPSGSPCQGPSPCAPVCDCPACRLMCLAKEAKMNVLLRKMESVIEKEHGEKLNAEAKLIVGHFMKLKAMKMEKKAAFGQEMESFHDQIMALWKE